MNASTAESSKPDLTVVQRPVYSSRDDKYIIQTTDLEGLAKTLLNEFNVARESARITHEALWSGIVEAMPPDSDRAKELQMAFLMDELRPEEWEENPEHGRMVEHWISLYICLNRSGLIFLSEYIHPSTPTRTWQGEYGRIMPEQIYDPMKFDKLVTLVLTTKEQHNISINPEFLYNIGERFGRRIS